MTRSILKDLFFKCFGSALLPAERASILMYHSISGRADYFSSVAPEAFNQHMRMLAELKRPVISLSELVRRLKEKEAPGGAVVLTFDDGYRDNYTTAYPVLKRYGFPATIFVTSDLIGQKDKRGIERLHRDELLEMQASGLIDIEPHTKTHPHLSAIDISQAEREIEGSRDAIESLRGSPARFFAYPYGDFDERIADVVATQFEAAMSVGEGTVHARSPLMQLPRNAVDRSTSLVQFRGKVSIAIDWYRMLRV